MKMLTQDPAGPPILAIAATLQIDWFGDSLENYSHRSLSLKKDNRKWFGPLQY